jgi:hypothetical protein
MQMPSDALLQIHCRVDVERYAYQLLQQLLYMIGVCRLMCECV